MDDNDEENKNVPCNMAKIAAIKKTKAAASASKKAGAKTLGEEVININTHPEEEAACHQPGRTYFSTKTLKGYRDNHYSKGSKNCINVVFHKGGIPSKKAQPIMYLDQGVKALKVEWKLSEHLFTDKQAKAQAIPKDSMWYNWLH
jgi:hypothetical protein